MASSPRRTLIWARRVDQRRFNRGVDTDNFPDRPLARIGTGARGELHPQRVAEVLLQGGVVGLRRGHLGFEQHPSVD